MHARAARVSAELHLHGLSLGNGGTSRLCTRQLRCLHICNPCRWVLQLSSNWHGGHGLRTITFETSLKLRILLGRGSLGTPEGCQEPLDGLNLLKEFQDLSVVHSVVGR